MEEINAFTRLLETLRGQPVLTLFLILGMGYLIGNIRIGSFSLGPVAGVLFAGSFSRAISISACLPVHSQSVLHCLFFLSGTRRGRGFSMC